MLWRGDLETRADILLLLRSKVIDPTGAVVFNASPVLKRLDHRTALTSPKALSRFAKKGPVQTTPIKGKPLSSLRPPQILVLPVEPDVNHPTDNQSRHDGRPAGRQG